MKKEIIILGLIAMFGCKKEVVVAPSPPAPPKTYQPVNYLLMAVNDNGNLYRNNVTYYYKTAADLKKGNHFLSNGSYPIDTILSNDGSHMIHDWAQSGVHYISCCRQLDTLWYNATCLREAAPHDSMSATGFITMDLSKPSDVSLLHPSDGAGRIIYK